MTATQSAFSISVIIPVYNGEKTIIPLVNEIVKTLRELYKLEVVLINDASPDNSEQACTSLCEAYPDIVKFYSLAKNVGEHNAVMAGLNQSTGDYMVIVDDDFQNPISEIVKLLTYATENDFDVTYTYYKRKEHSFFRNLGSSFNDKVANVMLKKPKDLYLSSFKVLNRFLVNEIIKYDLPFPYIDGLIIRTTSKIGKIEVAHHKRASGKSGYTLTKLISLWLNAFTNFSILPLRIAMLAGFCFAVLGFLLGTYVIIEKFLNPIVPIGYASLYSMVSIFSGAQLMSIGMIGEYVGRIFLSQNRKPQYTIRKKYEQECKRV